MINIKPINGKMKVIDPDTRKPIVPNGIFVQKVSQYWKNRKIDGDVTIVDMKKIKKKKETN